MWAATCNFNCQSITDVSAIAKTIVCNVKYKILTTGLWDRCFGGWGGRIRPGVGHKTQRTVLAHGHPPTVPNVWTQKNQHDVKLRTVHTFTFMWSVSVLLTLIAPRQNPYSRAATKMLRMRLNRDERGLVVAKEQEITREDQEEPKNKWLCAVSKLTV